MNWLKATASRSAAVRAEDGSEHVDYSYVFGNQRGGQRHDPHAQRQAPDTANNISEIANIIRKAVSSSAE